MRSLLTVIALLAMFALFSGQTTEAQIEAIVPFFYDITVPIPIEASVPFCSVRVGNPEASGGFELVGNADKRWSNGTTLKVAVEFTGTTVPSDFVGAGVCNIVDSDAACKGKVINLILEHASEWSKWGNIYFQYTPSWNDGHIRIRFDAGGGLNSEVGKDSIKEMDKKSMNLDITLWNTIINNIIGAIFHEFWHAIGLEHEHKRPDTPYEIR